ncbi:uncharacterized protein LOC105868919 [Microcebus murinus]|uniref:uncharacterized protein LOC105868919 n=1 Tax=Microcebus murinus TaxID=30608 RepID=UPI003F6B5452
MGTTASVMCCPAAVCSLCSGEEYTEEVQRRKLEWYMHNMPKSSFVGCLQRAGEVYAENILITFQKLQAKIIKRELANTRCQMVADITILFLKRMNPQREVEDACTSVLLALGSHSIEMVIDMLLYDIEENMMPPRSLLLALKELSLRPDIDSYRDATWARILSLLRNKRREEDMLLLCQGEGRGVGKALWGSGREQRRAGKDGVSECGSQKPREGAGGGWEQASVSADVVLRHLVCGQDPT